MAAVSFETTKAHAALSWATIVKRGDSDASAEETAGSAAPGKTALSPGPRGSRTCECRGQVIMMLAYYGWIAPLQDIDHPDAGKHEGHIYVRATDVAPGASLAPGQAVSFYLYADDQGLGAEDCRPDGADGADEFCFRAAAQEFVPSAGFCAAAPEFVPSAGFRAAAPEFVPVTSSHAGWALGDVPTGVQWAHDAADSDTDTDLSSDAGGAVAFSFRAAAPEFLPPAGCCAAAPELVAASGLVGVLPPGAQKSPGAADADTDLASSAGGDSEDAASDSEDSLCAGLCGPGPAAGGARPLARAVGLESHEDRGAGAEARREAAALPPPAAPGGGGIGSAPWRSHAAPPGLGGAAPRGWRLECLQDGASLPRDLPWRRC
ncbi:unnamed protein product [Prorocentrum cordatum]|uniref:Uncharacterized protein n=1 Tax=Prorocentrum cordatum TaxID=2364126 RepID=A0ABN9PTW3_9DINO|nr:unnamed protein product [Polarella glacialis]